jgi:hypothetical protein
MNDVVWRWFVVGYGDDHLWGFDGEMWWIFSNSLRFAFSFSHPFYQCEKEEKEKRVKNVKKTMLMLMWKREKRVVLVLELL